MGWNTLSGPHSGGGDLVLSWFSNAAMQSQKAVASYLKSKQLLRLEREWAYRIYNDRYSFDPKTLPYISCIYAYYVLLCSNHQGPHPRMIGVPHNTLNSNIVIAAQLLQLFSDNIFVKNVLCVQWINLPFCYFYFICTSLSHQKL